MGVPVFGPLMRKLFGTRNQRMVNRYLRHVSAVNSLEDQVRSLTDAQLKEKTAEFMSQLDGAPPDDQLLAEIFAVGREAMDRSVGIRNIFNPEHGFDPDLLEPSEQEIYRSTKEIIDATPDREAVDDLLGNEQPVKAWQFVDIPNELYEAVRRLYPQSRPPFRARPFDVQLIGGVVLSEGRIAEMKTGEGKTIVAPLACYLACLQGKQVHVVTVNDYLVQRDRDWTFPFFRALGLTVGAIHPMHMQPPPLKKQAYACNVVYGTTSEFGFDYLRDNMKLRAEDQVQKNHDFAIVDEVDSILIDEARTPLIISGPAHQHTPRYELADRLARHLVQQQKDWNKADEKVQSCMVDISSLEGDIRNSRDKEKSTRMKTSLAEARDTLPRLEAERDKYTQFYEVELDKKRANLTHDGITEAQKIAGVGSFYVGDNIDLPHLLEQAIRAHTVYQRDRDYVVAPDEQGQSTVVIVDQNTGRKMVGRQWSDGLHQAVESKESVPIKEETQTMATITIQNYFKMYNKLAGMTGTADTEATEFHEIYKLDVISIPTNVPVLRDDRNDYVFMSEKDKWSAIVDEIKNHHDMGRPVLVGTTSVEKSEQLSSMLTRKHGVPHEVLNAKQHEREADIVQGAGQLGAVTIATNMAGRGTDIKLGACIREQLIEHFKKCGICPKNVTASMTDDEILHQMNRQMAVREMGLKQDQLKQMDDEQIRHALLSHWAQEQLGLSQSKSDSMSNQKLESELDRAGGFTLHRVGLYEDTNHMGGLHIVGTERHESRRIDNQLRGRSGRQGDNGSSRFFLSLEDDLMKMFATKNVLGLLSKMGMKEGDVIEHPLLNRTVVKAQRKVEERNFQIRKNILDYDEPMEHQRQEFYGMRQPVLVGEGIKDIIFDYIDESVAESSQTYLDPAYPGSCISEWVREELGVHIDPDRIKGKDREELHELIRTDAKEDASNMITVTVGEYMPEELDQDDWDLKSLSDWAKGNFSADIMVSNLRQMSPEEARESIEIEAHERIDQLDLSPTDRYLVDQLGQNELAAWCTRKFGTTVEADQLDGTNTPEQAKEQMMEIADRIYGEREVSYPVEFAMEMTNANMQKDSQAALKQFCTWANSRYELEWTPQALPSTNPAELRKILIEHASSWDEDRIHARATKATESCSNPEELDQWFQQNCFIRLDEDELTRAQDEPQKVAEEKLDKMLRGELTQFERWVLLQIYDSSWKDHLHAMDQVRDTIGYQAFSQRDPRIEFKRESARLFSQMLETVHDKVTDVIFKGRLMPQGQQAEAQPAQQQSKNTPAPPTEAQPAVAAAAMAHQGTAEQRESIRAAEQASKQEPGAARQPRAKAPVKKAPTVGRNEPCPCGSGKKYKQCCGKRG